VSDILAMQRAVWTSARSANEKLTLLAIIDYYSASSQEPWPSVATLCKRASLGRTTIIEALATLERDGVIAVRRDHGRSNRYDLSRVCTALTPVRETDQSATRTGTALTAVEVPTPAPVRATNQSAPRTSPPSEPPPSATRTGPVRLANPKEPKMEPIKEATAVRVRAKLVLERADEAERQRPQDWPEVRTIVEAFSRGIGQERKLGELARDSGLRAVIALLAAGYEPNDLAWVAEQVPKQRWWREGPRSRGLATFSAEVVARALAEREGGGGRESDARTEERRLRRNALLSNAEAGRYGAEIRRRALAGTGLKLLADELERIDARGELSKCTSPSSASTVRRVC
jgi:hypothetical protein